MQEKNYKKGHTGNYSDCREKLSSTFWNLEARQLRMEDLLLGTRSSPWVYQRLIKSIYIGVLKPKSTTTPVGTAQVAMQRWQLDKYHLYCNYMGILKLLLFRFFFSRLCTPKNTQLTGTSPNQSIETRTKKKKSKNGKWTKAILIKESYSDLPFSQVHGESLRNMSHKKAVSALRSASSPVRITIYREDPESIFTSSEGNEWLHNNLYFIALIGNTYHSHIIILFCLFFLLIIILLLLFLFLRMYLSQRPCVPGIPWFMLYTFSLHSDTEPSAIFEVNLVKSITDYIGFSILARKYVLHNRYFVKKKTSF